MDVLLLRFDAPLMSFGSVVVDRHNRTELFPYRAMLTGLIANAFGWERREADALSSLQDRLVYAARRDRPGELLIDYQTVDFDPDGPLASNLGWTSHGQLEERKGGEASEGTHIRLRHYLADAIVTVALTLLGSGARPTLDEVSWALRAPARPLFLGRKCCVPSGPIWLGEATAKSLREALEFAPRAPALHSGGELRSEVGPLHAIWPAGEGAPEVAARSVGRVEDRDWANAVHVGRRMYVEGAIDPRSEAPQDPTPGGST